MDDFFTPVSTTYRNGREEATQVEPRQSTSKINSVSTTVTTLEEAIESLKNQPDYDALTATLRYLCDKSELLAGRPSPQTAAVTHLLVAEITPNYWALLLESSSSASSSNGSVSKESDAGLLIRCVRNVTGLNAILAHINSLLAELHQRRKDVLPQDIHLHLQIFLDLTAAVLRGPGSIREMWTASVNEIPDAALRKTQAQTLNSLIASSRVLSVVSEAATAIGLDKIKTETRFITDGAEYTSWIAANITAWAKKASEKSEVQACYDIFQRALSLGYQNVLVNLLIENLLLQNDPEPAIFMQVCFHQPAAFKKTMQIVLDYLAHKFLNSITLQDPANNKTVSAVAGIIHLLIKDDLVRKSFIVSWCTASSGAGLGAGIGIRRAVLSALATDNDAITSVLEKSLSQFGDQLYIKHTAILQQQVHTQILLLSAGYVSRLSPIRLTMIVKSGAYMRTISNRIASTQERARMFGMVVGEALSTLVDKGKNKLDFHMEEMETAEIQSLKTLISISDTVGPFTDLLLPIQSVESVISIALPQNPTAKLRRKPAPRSSTASNLPKAIIEEIDSSEDEDDNDGLVPYAKGSDPEDSDDDAELVQRNKLKPPVYVRDLISYFRDVENYDKQKLALQTAPILVRRKANYGTEVQAHAEELAGILVGLQDKFELDGFGEMQLQGMIALIVAQPKLMAPWFARTFFEGDYSLSQRTAVLIAVGLASREVAGFDTGSFTSAANFPSKQLPEKIQQLYIDAKNKGQPPPADGKTLKALPPNAIESISLALTTEFLAPVAARAADAATGPDVLKLRYNGPRAAASC
ncbi:hypothetical protein NQ176_g1580 [Zarea fungicola]|uniref:Uncharacterized protein n=1 Tax=Zarea fungicola TaxID=93591 RepID=A0ACC1NSV9_9HYPO|nr:hypothetical protein NQ176_g1580 [Lecanicillium fungicola]